MRIFGISGSPRAGSYNMVADSRRPLNRKPVAIMGAAPTNPVTETLLIDLLTALGDKIAAAERRVR